MKLNYIDIAELLYNECSIEKASAYAFCLRSESKGDLEKIVSVVNELSIMGGQIAILAASSSELQKTENLMGDTLYIVEYNFYNQNISEKGLNCEVVEKFFEALIDELSLSVTIISNF